MKKLTLILALALVPCLGTFNRAMAADDPGASDSSYAPKHHGHRHHKCAGKGDAEAGKDVQSDQANPTP